MTAVILQNHVQAIVRAFHRRLFRRSIPRKLGLYLHSTSGQEARLEELVCFLLEQNYAFVGPDAFATSADRVVFLSFDDNYRSWLDVLPLFEKFRVRATFYVNSWPFRDRVGNAEVCSYLEKLKISSREDTTLSTGNLREIAGAGHWIGAHTHTHPVLTSLPQDLAREEIRVGKEELERILQHPVTHFSYPFGMRRHFNRSLQTYCRTIGFSTVAHAIPCMQYARNRPGELHRSAWFLNQPLEFNLANVCVDGRLFQTLTGRSAVGGDPH